METDRTDDFGGEHFHGSSHSVVQILARQIKVPPLISLINF